MQINLKLKTSIILILLLFSVPFHFITAQKTVRRDSICFNKTTISISEVLDQLRETGYVLAYNPSDINYDKEITLESPCIKISALLLKIAPPEFFKVVIKDNKIIITQNKAPITIYGTILEANGNSALMGASIRLKNSNIGTFSNENGKFALTIPNKNAQLIIGYIGYKTDTLDFHVDESTYFNIKLKLISQKLREVHIVASPINTNSVQSSKLQIGLSTETASSLGTPDPIATVASLPEVSGGLSGFCTYSVRGGNSAENLILLNGIPIYNYLHFTGLLSVIDQDALRSATFYKGLFPAQYNGRLSSILDLRLKDGDFTNYHGMMSIDLLKAGMRFEGPIIKNKLSIMSSLRTSILNYPFQLLFNDINFKYQFTDSYTQITYAINEKNRVNFSLYNGKDKFNGLIYDQKLNWGNHLTAINWQYQISPEILLNTKAYYSLYQNKFEDEHNNTDDYALPPSKSDVSLTKNTINDLAIQTDLDWFTRNNHKLKAGASLIRHKSHTGHPYDVKNILHNKQYSWELNTYIDGEASINKNWKLGFGTNISNYNVSKHNFFYFLPRLRVLYSPTPNQIFYAGFSKMAQFYHELSSPLYSVPNDFRMMSNKDLKPATAQLNEIGIRFLFSNILIDWSAFMRNAKHIITFKPGQDINNHKALNWKDRVVEGGGTSHGTTFTLQWKPNNFNLLSSISYNSASEHYDIINENRSFISNNAPKWMIKLMISTPIKKRLLFAMNTTFSSGKRISIPIYQLKNPFDVSDHNSPNYVLSEINSYKLPKNLMVNISFAYFCSKPKDKIQRILRFGLTNLAGKAQPITQWFNFEENKPIIETVLIPKCLPNINYEIKF